MRRNFLRSFCKFLRRNYKFNGDQQYRLLTLCIQNKICTPRPDLQRPHNLAPVYQAHPVLFHCHPQCLSHNEFLQVLEHDRPFPILHISFIQTLSFLWTGVSSFPFLSLSACLSLPLTIFPCWAPSPHVSSTSS